MDIEIWESFGKAKPLTYEEARQVVIESKAVDLMGDVDREKAIDYFVKDLLNCTTFVNNLYQVAVYEPEHEIAPGLGVIHLSIKRRDRKPIINWNHLQRIKNEIVGPEYEAVELFPAESRLVNLANQYHLWVLSKKGARFPFGFSNRAVRGQIEGSKAVQHLE